MNKKKAQILPLTLTGSEEGVGEEEEEEQEGQSACKK